MRAGRSVVSCAAAFAAALAVARMIPGASVVNLAVIIGQRLRGLSGAIAAVLGVLVGPSLAVIALALLYERFGSAPMVMRALAGAAAAAVGLLFGMGFNSAKRLFRANLASPRYTLPKIGLIVVLAATFVMVGILRWSTVTVVLCLVPCSIALAAWAGPRVEAAARRGRG